MHIHATEPLKIRVLTHNIRYAANPQAKGEAPWRERLPELLRQFRYHTEYAPHTFICLQEVLAGQLDDLLNGLNSGGDQWASIGVGRDDGKSAGEYTPILYRPDIWKLKHIEYFWLSETPERPSFGWDAGCRRIVTVGIFRHRDTGRQVAAICTHLDNAGVVAREKGAELLIGKINSLLRGHATHANGQLPVFLAGDMNSPEEDGAYRVFTAEGSPVDDAKLLAESHDIYGFKDTFTGFDGNGDQDGKRRLDYVFVSHHEPLSWTVRGYATLPNIFDDAAGIYLSDHRAVVVDLTI